jgi:hypothetical protein
MRIQWTRWGVMGAAAAASVAIAGTLMQLDAPLEVSTAAAANSAYKAKMGWQSYMSDAAGGKAAYDVKVQLLVYSDGPADAQDIWVARSTDNGATWAQTNVTNNGGTPFNVTDPVSGKTGTFSVNHYKANIYVAPVGVLNGGKGANALLSWTSSDCEGSPAQRINANLVPLTGKDQPFSCLWTARSNNGGLTWTTQRLTDGGMDADNDVLGGSVKYTNETSASGYFAVAFQADPEGLQLGEAEGTGDGASGANVSPGTNIWYSHLSKSAFEAGTRFPPPVQVSDNNANAEGSPGASRPNLFLSGNTAILAYEETKGDGSSGKQIIYHSFAANSPTLDGLPAGTAISNPANNARRVRFVAQGNEALGDADQDGDAADGDTVGVHVLLLWRETTLTTPAAASDIMVRRGIKNTAARAGSTGFRPEDILADTPINLSDPGASSLVNNAKAHRAVLRGDFAAVAYDLTTNLAASDATPPKATYNLFVHRSTDGGNTWSGARNMSRITDPAVRVAEPRMVPTPGTIKLPNGTATGDPEDVQDRNVYFVGWGTETNEPESKPLDIYITRTIDQGENYERVQPLAEGATEQSEAQLRMPPDGKTLGAIWMQEETVAGTKEVMYRNGGPVTTGLPDPDLSLTATSTSFSANAQGQVTFTAVNQGAGDSRSVILTGTAPAGLTLVSTSDANVCTISGSVFTCTIPEILAGANRAISLNVTSAAQGSYALPATVSGDVLETDDTNNAATGNVTVYGDGGGCTTVDGNAPFDPMLPAIAALGLVGWGLRRARRS